MRSSSPDCSNQLREHAVGIEHDPDPIGDDPPRAGVNGGCRSPRPGGDPRHRLRVPRREPGVAQSQHPMSSFRRPSSPRAPKSTRRHLRTRPARRRARSDLRRSHRVRGHAPRSQLAPAHGRQPDLWPSLATSGSGPPPPASVGPSWTPPDDRAVSLPLRARNRRLANRRPRSRTQAGPGLLRVLDHKTTCPSDDGYGYGGFPRPRLGPSCWRGVEFGRLHPRARCHQSARPWRDTNPAPGRGPRRRTGGRATASRSASRRRSRAQSR